MTTTEVDPARLRLERDLANGDFAAGVDAGLWRLVEVAWPSIDVAITAGDGNELTMRIQVDDYPRLAPAGRPWDLDADAPLGYHRWPTGGHAPQVFRPDWSKDNHDAPYMACDRTGLATHPGWATSHPERSWNPTRTIAFYVAEIWRELRGATMPKPGKN